MTISFEVKGYQDFLLVPGHARLHVDRLLGKIWESLNRGKIHHSLSDYDAKCYQRHTSFCHFNSIAGLQLFPEKCNVSRLAA